MRQFCEHISGELLERIAARAEQTDQQQHWPGAQLQGMAEAGLFRWGIPPEWGGEESSSQQLLRFYLDCSRCCLNTAFIFSQWQAAVSRLLSCDHRELQARVLPRLTSGEWFTTVGISHLSTSRQHLASPAVTATPTESGYRLNGTVPWVTGGAYADVLVTGGTLSDGRQVLLLVERGSHGLTHAPPEQLLALTATHTGQIQFNEVEVPATQLLAGPVEQVMKAGGGGTGSLTTSVLAAGVAWRAVLILQQEAAQRSDLRQEADQLQQECHGLIEDLLQADAHPERFSTVVPQTLRTRANSLVLRASQAALVAAKGAGFLAGHPAERTLREAMFFLVWSCPQPVAQAALRELACTPGWQ